MCGFKLFFLNRSETVCFESSGPDVGKPCSGAMLGKNMEEGEREAWSFSATLHPWGSPSQNHIPCPS